MGSNIKTVRKCSLFLERLSFPSVSRHDPEDAVHIGSLHVSQSITHKRSPLPETTYSYHHRVFRRWTHSAEHPDQIKSGSRSPSPSRSIGMGHAEADPGVHLRSRVWMPRRSSPPKEFAQSPVTAHSHFTFIATGFFSRWDRSYRPQGLKAQRTSPDTSDISIYLNPTRTVFWGKLFWKKNRLFPSFGK